MRRLVTVFAGMTVGATALLGPASASPTIYGDEPFCGQAWGSLPETRQMTTSEAVVTDVRAGRHVCFDRLVVDLVGPVDRELTYDVRYVDPVTEQGSGRAIALRGGATLRVIVGAPAYDDDHRPTHQPGDDDEVVDTTGFETIHQVAWAGSFEGQTALGLGTRARLPFRVFSLSGDAGGDQALRLVIDIGHRW
jgi:hypothetical protein